VPLAITIVSATSVTPRTSNTLISQAFMSSSALRTTALSAADRAAAARTGSRAALGFAAPATLALMLRFTFTAPFAPSPLVLRGLRFFRDWH